MGEGGGGKVTKTDASYFNVSLSVCVGGGGGGVGGGKVTKTDASYFNV